MRAAICLTILLALAGCNARPHRQQANSGVTMDIPPAPPETNQANEAVAVKPPPKPKPAPETPPPAPATNDEAAQNDEVAAPERPAARPARAAAKPKKKAAASDEAPAVAADSKPAKGARAPLGDATIVSTIRRIGYQCDHVVSADRVAGGAGDETPSYKIVCGSGESYRATRRNGHLVFREWTRAASQH